MTPLQVYWARCMVRGKRVWCLLKEIDTESVNTGGVYVIWHGGHVPRVIYIGNGDIASRINHHRSSSRILQYETKGLLMVTWATVPSPNGKVSRSSLWTHTNLCGTTMTKPSLSPSISRGRRRPSPLSNRLTSSSCQASTERYQALKPGCFF